MNEITPCAMSDTTFDEPCVPGDDEWLHRRLVLFLADETERWWWLSFVDTDRSDPFELQRPGGGGFIGVCIVPGGNIVQAAHTAHALDCNPGGEVGGFLLPGRPKPEFVGTLYRGEAAEALADIEWEDMVAS